MIAAIVQARMGSTRLPGKVLMPAAGKPLLAHLLERLGRSETIDRIVVATSTDARDDAIHAFCTAAGVEVFRGSESDVLDRYHQCARSIGADVVVRVTADCPLIDPSLVDHLVRRYQSLAPDVDLVTNRRPLTFPDGTDLDVFSAATLERVSRVAHTPTQREHVIPYFWEAGLRVHNVEHPENLFLRHRWTLDYPEDYALIVEIIEGMYRPGTVFGIDEILEFLASRPELSQLNARHLPTAESSAAPPAAASAGRA